MSRRHALYSLFQVLWGVAWLAIAGVVGAGLAGSVLPGLALPASPPVVAAGAVAVAIVGWIGIGHLKARAWRGLGRAVGLAPDPTGGLGERYASGPGASVAVSPLPDLVGTVDGREVRVTTYASSSSGPSDSSRTFTVVKASLDAPVDESMLLLPAEADDAGIAALVPGGVDADVVDGEFDVIAQGSGERAEQILAGRARNALLELGDMSLIVGDATDLVLEEMMGGMAGQMAMMVGDGAIEDALGEHPAFDASAVSIATRGVVFDEATLQRQIAAVTAVADAVDRVSTDPPRA